MRRIAAGLRRGGGCDMANGAPGGENRPRPYFGARLRELRETYQQRLQRLHPEQDTGVLMRRPPSTSDLLYRMREEGYTMSIAAYNEIENGLNVPRDAPRFVDVVAKCLLLSQEEKQDLERRLAYAILYGRLGKRTDDVFPPDKDWKN